MGRMGRIGHAPDAGVRRPRVGHEYTNGGGDGEFGVGMVRYGSRGPTGDESPVYCAAPDESGFAVRPWVPCIVARTASSGAEARFSGHCRIAWR